MKQKRISYHTILMGLALILMSSCGGEKPNRPAPVLTQDQINQRNATVDAPAVPTGGLTSGVKHYICPNGHLEGGSDAQGTCINCGATLVHNQEWHNQQQQPQAQPQDGPAQNANGEWHYTCPNGHPGAGAAGTCASCGATLVHNAAYHN